MFEGRICVHVWGFALPLEPSLKSSFNGCCRTVLGAGEELLRNRIMPDTVDPADERMFIHRYGLNATDLGFFSGVSYGECNASEPPSVQVIKSAKAKHQPDLYLYDDSADPESSCTSPAFYSAMIAWAQNLHRAGVENLATQEPVSQLYDDGLGTGRSAVDIWTMLPLAYDDAQSFSPPRVTHVLQKGDKASSYNALVQDSYSPKWELDFLPIDYRIQAGFISQSLGLTGLLYWSVDDWSPDPWENPQGGQNPDYPGEGVLVYPGGPAGLKGVAPSMRLSIYETESRTTNTSSFSRIVGKQASPCPRPAKWAVTGATGREKKACGKRFASNWEIRSPPAIAIPDCRRETASLVYLSTSGF